MPILSRERILDSLLEPSSRLLARSRPELLETILRCALTLGEGDGAVLLSGQGRRLDRTLSRRDLANAESAGVAASGGELVRLLMLHAHPVVVPDASADARIGRDHHCDGVDAGPAVFVPMRVRVNDPGYLAVYRRRGALPFTQEEIRLLVLLSAWAAMALENRRLSGSVEKLAVTDDLTRIYNYRFLKTGLRREIKRAGRFRQDLSVIMIDVDNLKSYNDRHGHLRGSFLLREMAGLLTQQVRSWDLVAKYGGDEFTVILPQTACEGAMIAAERLRAAIANHAFPLATQGQITVSLGVACFPMDGETAATLLQSSDRALYAAKQQGRNRVEVAGREAA